MADKAQVVSESTETVIESSSTGCTPSGVAIRTSAAVSSRTSSEVETYSSVSEKHSTANFTEAVTKVMKQFGPLGKWIQDQINQQIGSISATLDVPKLYEEFKGLSPVLKVLVVIGILGLLCLLKWMTWAAVGYIWPYVQDFINSSTGKKIIENFTGFLNSLADSRMLATFSSIFSTAASEQRDKSQKAIKGAESSDDESSDEDSNKKAKSSGSKIPSSACFKKEQFDQLNTETNFSMIVLEIIQSFFSHLGTVAGVKA